MSPKAKTKTGNKNKASVSETVLLVLSVLLLLPALTIFVWYGLTRFTTTQHSAIVANTVEISSEGSTCQLEIPAGSLTIQKPQRAAVGSNYRFSADVQLDTPLRLTNCTGTLPNWSIYLEGQTTLVGANVQPYATIRQPASGRDSIKYEWTFTPEEPIAQYQSHFYLRAIITEQDQTVERWNLLVRDFPMENIALFGQPTVLWLIVGGISALVGILLLIILLQMKRKRKA